jgi:hypothetical protein
MRDACYKREKENQFPVCGLTRGEGVERDVHDDTRRSVEAGSASGCRAQGGGEGGLVCHDSEGGGGGVHGGGRVACNGDGRGGGRV